MDRLWQDLRFSVRTLRKTPGFTVVVTLTLALGIGANTTIFSLLYGILLRPYPYRAPEQLVRIQTVATQTTGNVQGGSVSDLDDWRSQTASLVDLGGYLTYDNILTSNVRRSRSP